MLCSVPQPAEIKKLREKDNVAHLMPLFEKLKTNKPMAIHFNTIFFIRRYIFVCMLIFL